MVAIRTIAIRLTLLVSPQFTSYTKTSEIEYNSNCLTVGDFTGLLLWQHNGIKTKHLIRYCFAAGASIELTSKKSPELDCASRSTKIFQSTRMRQSPPTKCSASEVLIIMSIVWKTLMSLIHELDYHVYPPPGVRSRRNNWVKWKRSVSN